ncbi:MAG: hypothetical protein IJ660_05990 [Alphaproteobacteria bacterium]|nr:hypothetical protein [Alphaproteobacteria bacterium]
MAGGILLGSAGVFISNKKTDTATQTVLWCLLMLPLFFGSVALGVWCENQAHPHSLLPILSQLMVAAIWLYGVILGIAIFKIKGLKKALEDPLKKEWITAACSNLFLFLPVVLWVIFLLSPWDSYTSLAIAIGISAIIMTLLWIFFHFARLLKYGFRKPAV